MPMQENNQKAAPLKPYSPLTLPKDYQYLDQKEYARIENMWRGFKLQQQQKINAETAKQKAKQEPKPPKELIKQQSFPKTNSCFDSFCRFFQNLSTRSSAQYSRLPESKRSGRPIDESRLPLLKNAR